MDFLIKFHLFKSRCLFFFFFSSSYLANWNWSEVTNILECECYPILHDTECYYTIIDFS